MTDYPWFKFDVAKEQALMNTMTDEQYGAHMRLRLHAWTMHGLPVVNEELRAIGRWTTGQWRRIWPVVSRQWCEYNGRLVNETQEAARLDAESRRESGRNASAKRWHSDRNATALPTQCHRQDSTGQDKTEQKNDSLTLVVARETTPPPLDLSPGQLQAAVPGLVGAWNNIAATVPPFVAVTVRSHPKATAALREHPSIDWWSGVFSRVIASYFLRGLQPLPDGRTFIADFWWCVEHADKIAAGRYDNRERVAPPAPPTKAQALTARNAAAAEIVIASLRAEGAIS